MSQKVYEHFQRSVEAKMRAGEAIAPQIEYAAEVMVHTLLEDRRILVCATGDSAALAQIFVANMLDNFEKERPGLPAILLNPAVPSDRARSTSRRDEVFSKTLRAVAQPGDMLLTICVADPPPSILRAIDSACEREVNVIALTGYTDGSTDIENQLDVAQIAVEGESICRIHEIHLLVLYCLCDLIDHKLFGIE